MTRLRTVLLGSGSTQEWAATELCGSRDDAYQQSYTEFLHQRLNRDEGDGDVNLSFGLCSGRSSTTSRKVVVCPHPDDYDGQVTAVVRPSKSPVPVWEASGNNRDPPRQQFRSSSVSRSASARPPWMQSPSPLSAGSTAARRRGECGEKDAGFADIGDERDGREVWAEHRRELRLGRKESITRGVQRLRVGEHEKEKEAPVLDVDDHDDDDNDGEGGEEDEGYVSSLRQDSIGGSGGKTKTWASTETRRPCGKKWDNLMRRFKKVHHFNGLSGKQDFFQLSTKERTSKGFNFNTDCVVYDDIVGSTAKNHTIHPKNVADTGGRGGVRLLSTSSADPESVGDGDAGAGQDEDDDGLTKGSSQTTGGPGGFRKRKSTRQQTFEVMIECMEKHEALMVSTMESASKRQCSIQIRQCEALEAEVEVLKKHYAVSNEVSKLMCHALLEMAKAIRELNRSNLAAKRASGCRRVDNTTSPSLPSLSSCLSVRSTLIVIFVSIIDIVNDIAAIIFVAIVIAAAVIITVDMDNEPCFSDLQLVSRRAVVLCAMSSHGAGRGKNTTNQAMEAAMQEKKGRHNANKKRKVVQGGPSDAGSTADDEWVGEEVAPQERSDFEEEEEAPLKRTVRRTGGGIRIKEGGIEAPAKDDVEEVAHELPTSWMWKPRRHRGRAWQLALYSRIARPFHVSTTPRTSTSLRSTHENQQPCDNGRLQTLQVVRKRSLKGTGTVLLHRRRRGPLWGGASHARDAARAGDVVGEGEDDEALVNRMWRRDARVRMEAASKLWPLTIRQSIVLPHTTIPQQKIEDETELNTAKERPFKVQTIALRVIHGWVFKSTSGQRGYHAAYGYALNHVATDIARAMWTGEDWCICVSSMVFHITLDTDMKLPLLFVRADIEDMHENDDDLAAYQEESIQRRVGAFTSAVSMAEGIDGGRVSYERLKSVADAMRIMLATTMWFIRMSGDDHRAHYDAWVFVQLTMKPMLVASMHRSFDARRYILQAATVITDKLARPPMTLIDPPLYIPDWASCGVKFSHDANLPSPMDAKKLDWLGTGPPDEEEEEKGDDEAGGGG
ncbi:hypothetical protein CBR_g56092 [Chara braunii]|uniref:Uncharacterized protein n=1 Tax=Chara braunii TaxID=69332 RepID=A0A388MDM8_CHABU|nr:hypothetical protein CBR_g56092 [Chara braunii]|eukprot:GBG92579.1 hypothetical protein CBR_g56092 [Chara braunii]